MVFPANGFFRRPRLVACFERTDSSLGSPQSYLQPAPPLPIIEPLRPPDSPDDVRAAIVVETKKCAYWLQQMNEHGEGIVSSIDAFLRASARDLSQQDREAFSLHVRESIRSHDDAVIEHVPRCVKALGWCNSGGRAEEAPEADKPCKQLQDALFANKEILQDKLAPRFEIMRAASGTWTGYIAETMRGLLDPKR